MYRNSKPIATAGNNQVVTGIKIQGKNDAAYEPVIIEVSYLIISGQSLQTLLRSGSVLQSP